MNALYSSLRALATVPWCNDERGLISFPAMDLLPPHMNERVEHGVGDSRSQGVALHTAFVPPTPRAQTTLSNGSSSNGSRQGDIAVGEGEHECNRNVDPEVLIKQLQEANTEKDAQIALLEEKVRSMSAQLAARGGM